MTSIPDHEARPSDERQNATAFYAVRTTGIVCKRGCRSRAPRPENVVPFDALGEALAAGYRPCKRCKPDG